MESSKQNLSNETENKHIIYGLGDKHIIFKTANKHIIYENFYLQKNIMENNDTFDCLIIKPGSIQQVVSGLDLDYTSKLMELDLFQIIKTNIGNFIEVITTNLDLNKYKIQNLNIKTKVVDLEPHYIYTIVYIDLEKATEYHNETNLNELASLINGGKIYSNAIIYRTYSPSLSLTEPLAMCSITKEDLRRVLEYRDRFGIES